MAKTPKDGGEKAERTTRHLRMMPDLVDMATWICRVKGTTSAQLIDPVLRPFLVDLYADNYAMILKLAESRGEAADLPIVLGLNAPLNPNAPGEYPTPTQPEVPKAGGKSDGKAKGRKGK